MVSFSLSSDTDMILFGTYLDLFWPIFVPVFVSLRAGYERAKEFNSHLFFAFLSVVFLYVAKTFAEILGCCIVLHVYPFVLFYAYFLHYFCLSVNLIHTHLSLFS